MWRITTVDNRVLAYVEEVDAWTPPGKRTRSEKGGVLWTADIKPLGSVSRAGRVTSRDTYVGDVDWDGQFWGPGMKIKGWVDARKDRSIFALGSIFVANYEPDCPRRLAGAAGLILIANGLVELNPESALWHGRQWITQGAPKLPFPNLSFRPSGGSLVETPPYDTLAEDLARVVLEELPYTLPPKEPLIWPAAEVERLISESTQTVQSWMKTPLRNFQVDSNETIGGREVAEVLSSHLTPALLRAALERKDKFKPFIDEWLTMQLCKYGKYDGFRPVVKLTPSITIPLKRDQQMSDVQDGFTFGWIEGWTKSLTYANRFVSEDHDWRLATQCLDIDSDVKWWVRLASTALPRIPFGDPRDLRYIQPEFLVIDSADVPWVVVTSDVASRGQQLIRKSLERWVRGVALFSPRRRRWGAVMAIPIPQGDLTWKHLTEEFGVA